MNQSIRLLLAASACMLISAGCATTVARLSIASTADMQFGKAGGYWVDQSNVVVGKDVTHTIVVFPCGGRDIPEAMNAALQAAPGAVALANVVIREKGWWIPFIYGRDWFEVTGNPIFPNGFRPAPAAPLPPAKTPK